MSPTLELGTQSIAVFAAASHGSPGPFASAIDCIGSLAERVNLVERQIIQACLARHNFRRKDTAAELGISRVTLYNKMKKFGLLEV
ncbi:MAG TPA: helix-turn-helix domain-containing protein [Pirellulaceae bacterium]|nr:helix-turn-helix domain-containing protein [Pirellulaceae bacterium]